MRNPFLKSLRSAFFTGIIVFSPLAVTLFVFNWLVELIGGRYRDDFFYFLPDGLLGRSQLIPVWNFLATLVVLLVITLLGYLSRYFFGRFFLNLTERIMNNVPFISVIYATAKQIVETFSARKKAVFEKVVLIQFPRPGSYALGFLTSTSRGEIQGRTKEEVWNVFVPTTPNPTSGFLIMMPREQIVELDMTVGDGMKLIISGGTVVPPWEGGQDQLTMDAQLKPTRTPGEKEAEPEVAAELED
jgi:uncharacterized membrane protein